MTMKRVQIINNVVPYRALDVRDLCAYHVELNGAEYQVLHTASGKVCMRATSKMAAYREVVRLFNNEFAAVPYDRLKTKVFAPLAGHDLACDCPPDMPCHVDVLLRLLSHDG